MEPSTPSGKVDVVYKTKDVQCLENAMVNSKLNEGWEVKSRDLFTLIFKKPTQNFAANLLFSSQAYSTVDLRLSMYFVPTDGGTRVVTQGEIVGNPGSAFEQLHPVKLTAVQQTQAEAEASTGTPAGCESSIY